MNPDKDKPWTWLKFRNGMCEGCFGNCCTMPVEIKDTDLIRMGVVTEDELLVSVKKTAKRLIKEGIVQSYRDGTNTFMLSSRPNGDCLYLDLKSRLCTIYEKRPEVCRQFPSIGPRPGYCPSNRK